MQHDLLEVANKLELSEEHRRVVKLLLDNDQQHLFAAWPPKGKNDADKRRLLDQCIFLEKTVPGGITGYCTRAKAMLEGSKTGANPYEGYKPIVPSGVRLETESDAGLKSFEEMEELGLQQLADSCFVLVAGGLGERLGYNGIKIALPTEIVTETTFLQMYIQHILAFQAAARKIRGRGDVTLPLAIMTSDDTDAKTRALLNAHDYFGMPRYKLMTNDV